MNEMLRVKVKVGDSKGLGYELRRLLTAYYGTNANSDSVAPRVKEVWVHLRKNDSSRLLIDHIAPIYGNGERE